MHLLKINATEKEVVPVEIGSTIDVKATVDNKLTMSKKMFLNNVKNKQQFMNLTGYDFEKAGLIGCRRR